MKYRGSFANSRKLPFSSISKLLPALLLYLIASSPIFASPLAPASDEVKKLIKEAASLTRAASFPEAEALLRRAVDLDSGRSDAKVELAFVLTKERKIVEAYELVIKVAQAEPRNARAFSVLGTALLAGGRFPEARLVFHNALQLDRGDALAWAGCGMLDFYENRVEGSVQNLREALYHQPLEPDYLFAYGQIASRAELYDEAAEAYKRFLVVSPDGDADRRDRIRALVNFLHYLGQVGKLYEATGGDQASVKFDLVGNRPVVQLHVNGSEKPLRFVLDTGSGISVISDNTAKRLKIKALARGGYAKGLGGNGKFEMVYGLLKQVEIGDVRIRNVPVYLRRFQNDGAAIDGYIGVGLISKFLTTVDYGTQTFSLTKRVDETKTFRENGEFSLPLRLTTSGFLSGEVLLKGIDSPLNFIVDTGATVSVISAAMSKLDCISPFASPEKMQVIGSAGVTDGVPAFLLPSVSFGKHTRKDIMAVALDLGIINEASGFEQSGILGGNFLRNYRLTFDFKNSRVTFDAVQPDKEQAPQ